MSGKNLVLDSIKNEAVKIEEVESGKIYTFGSGQRVLVPDMEKLRNLPLPGKTIDQWFMEQAEQYELF